MLFPVLLMAFALSMERVESRLRRLVVEEEEVEQFLDQASPAEVDTFVREGLPNALVRFHRRRDGSRRLPGLRARAGDARGRRARRT